MVALRHSPMRIVEDREETKPSDRRMFERRPMRGTVLTRRLDHSLQSLQHPSLSLELRDLSLGGLSAISDLPINRGERVCVRLHSDGLPDNFSAYGRVVRCEMSGMGYRVAVEFDRIPMAA